MLLLERRLVLLALLYFPSENCLKFKSYSSCRRQVIGGVGCVSATGLPLLSCAGVNLALLRMMLHVAASSALLPVDWVMLQLWTRPSGPTVIEARAVPCAPAA